MHLAIPHSFAALKSALDYVDHVRITRISLDIFNKTGEPYAPVTLTLPLMLYQLNRRYITRFLRGMLKSVLLNASFPLELDLSVHSSIADAPYAILNVVVRDARKMEWLKSEVMSAGECGDMRWCVYCSDSTVSTSGAGRMLSLNAFYTHGR